MIFLSSVLCLSAIGFLGIHPFLALDAPVSSDILVVEGWMAGDGAQQLAAEFTEGAYEKIYTVGGPVGGMGYDAADDDTYAYVAMVKLRKAGISLDQIQMVPTRVQDRDRTYSSAISLRDYFREQQHGIKALNVATLGVHSRRSRLLFEKAFGPGVKIGVISIPHLDYPADRWWQYSEGVKEVISETAAYLYVRLFFWPDSKL